MVIAISCTGILTFFKKPRLFSRPSVSAFGVVVSVMIDEPRIKRIKRIPMYTAFSKPSHVIWRSSHTSIILVPGVKNRLKETVIKRIITILFNPLAINLNGTVDR